MGCLSLEIQQLIVIKIINLWRNVNKGYCILSTSGNVNPLHSSQKNLRLEKQKALVDSWVSEWLILGLLFVDITKTWRIKLLKKTTWKMFEDWELLPWEKYNVRWAKSTLQMVTFISNLDPSQHSRSEIQFLSN